ncbi:E3 ubiquitin-protein ligase rfwd3.S-like [Planococcus citri]|uniref:E3 ubiquitin-protein ligase rfwd3.S-like n=1 Tax=Planococcus citri TaxID=170843 RepID=UPI0031F7502C
MENDDSLDDDVVEIVPEAEAHAGSPIRIHQIAEEPREIGDIVVIADDELQFDGVRVIQENHAERPIVRIRRLDAEARLSENPSGSVAVVVDRSELNSGRRRIIAGPGIDDSPEEVVEEMDIDDVNIEEINVIEVRDDEPSVIIEQRNEPSTSSEQKNEPTKSSTAPLNDTDDGDAGQLCAICYSSYTNSGEHRLSCLKCGHLFGESCIKHWLKVGCQANSRRCPSCNAKATIRDIRVLYAKNLIALDTTEKDRLLEKLEKVQNEKNNIESQLNASSLKVDLLTKKVHEYEEKIRILSENNNQREQTTSHQGLSKFSSKVLSSFVLSVEGGCKVLAYSSHMSLLLASQCTTNPLFPGYGIRKINAFDMKPTLYHYVHKKTIRDMCFSPNERGSLLSVSLDKTAKLFDVQNNTVVQTFETPVPLWSCTWSSTNNYKFYCGSQNGTWFAFDKRQTRPEPEQIVESIDPNDKSGIISICHLPSRPGRFMPNGGIVACRLNNVVVHYPAGDTTASKVLPIEGSFMSMQYNKNNDHLLISTKASTKWTSSRHMICQLSEMKTGESDSECVDVLQTFYGSRITNTLSRSAFVPFPNGDVTVCAYNSRNNNLDLWSVVSETKLDITGVNLTDPVLDICSVRTTDKDIMIPCLSDKKLSVIRLNFEE